LSQYVEEKETNEELIDSKPIEGTSDSDQLT
jgi:hypothetical protein